MSVIGSNILAGASGQGGDYTIARSLRFRSSASAYLNRTPGSASNRRTFTISMWVKRGNSGSNISLVSCRSASSPYFQYQFYSDNSLSVEGGGFQLRTTQLFRDFSAWYHLVIAFDTTQATSSNRIKMYVNGAEVTSFQTATYPSQNTDTNFNVASATSIGSLQPFDTQYFDGYMAEIISVDGQALTPSSFGATNASTGVWQPKKYAGTYGTNGFYLPFTNNSTTTTLGNDFSGNGNNWTTNNISLTAGSTYDSMTDVPTLTSATAANFCVMNPLFVKGTTPVISNGNMKITGNGNYGYAGSTMSLDLGKWYWEATVTAGAIALNLGIITTQYPNTDLTGTGAVAFNGAKYSCNEAGSYTFNASQPPFTVGDTIGITFDSSTGELKFNVNNGSFYTVATKTPDGRSWFPVGNVYSSGDQFDFNFGQRPFAYTPPTGFVALNTFNLPTPTIGATASTQANKYFDATLYTGNGTSQSVVNAGGFQPDWVWIKMRSGAAGNELFDSARGANIVLFSNATNAESNSGTMSAFNSNGFTAVYQASDVSTNNNGSTYVGWQWKANGTGVSNTAGSITSTVSANTSAGFSVVTYSGQASDGTVGHGLGVAPKMIIVKNRTTGGTGWITYHASLPSASVSIMYLNRTDAVLTGVGTWNSTAPTSTVFSVDGGDSQVNAGSNNYVAYCFSEIAGYSKIGSYTGNANADGPFVYCGFRPKYIIIKNTVVAGNNWWIQDTARSTYNVQPALLVADSSSTENTSSAAGIDFLSNGFKPRTSDGGANGNGNTMIFIAFAENPFKYSLAR